MHKFKCLLVLVLLVLTGCAASEDNLQNVIVKLKWVHQAQFAGNYVAAVEGFYQEEGLQVEFVPFSFEEPTLEAVVDGDALFGIIGADELVMARAAGHNVQAIAVIYKINPVAAYTLTESAIIRPHDFVGKRVGLERGTNVDTLYNAMMAKLKIDRNQIEEIDIGYDATELLAGETDVSTGYIINEPHQAIEAGYEVHTILMADYGVNMYADVIIAKESTLNEQPELVEGFLRATLAGWQYAIENEEKAVNITMRYATDRTYGHESYMLRESIPLIHTGDSPIGWMEHDQWEQVERILREQHILEEDIDIGTAYTTRFLERIYFESS